MYLKTNDILVLFANVVLGDFVVNVIEYKRCWSFLLISPNEMFVLMIYNYKPSDIRPIPDFAIVDVLLVLKKCIEGNLF